MNAAAAAAALHADAARRCGSQPAAAPDMPHRPGKRPLTPGRAAGHVQSATPPSTPARSLNNGRARRKPDMDLSWSEAPTRPRPLLWYDGLSDPALAKHWCNPRFAKHLHKSGLVGRDGQRLRGASAGTLARAVDAALRQVVEEEGAQRLFRVAVRHRAAAAASMSEWKESRRKVASSIRRAERARWARRLRYAPELGKMVQAADAPHLMPRSLRLTVARVKLGTPRAEASLKPAPDSPDDDGFVLPDAFRRLAPRPRRGIDWESDQVRRHLSEPPTVAVRLRARPLPHPNWEEEEVEDCDAKLRARPSRVWARNSAVRPSWLERGSVTSPTAEESPNVGAIRSPKLHVRAAPRSPFSTPSIPVSPA
eukprot:TRINITY_DN28076_c0_g1_i1.p1 TRINITY_DN28076_c0_g1~~TRINITY_DN28076_c0_g1_i1.p1  ORF type:complete len:382 (+),score=77.03 TRINITY_DN28076_c0_g1_i1:47-1147(+)